MSIEYINRSWLEENDCFGCGHLNDHGLKITVFRDTDDKTRLLGQLEAKPYMTGFPGMMHGGVLYTALDCLASWTPTVLRAEMKAAWVLQSSNIRYLRPALQVGTIDLSAMIRTEGAVGQALVVQAEARDESGALLVRGCFKMLPLSADRFKKVAGLQDIPESLRHLLGEI